jgi:hypothetical protein
MIVHCAAAAVAQQLQKLHSSCSSCALVGPTVELVADSLLPPAGFVDQFVIFVARIKESWQGRLVRFPAAVALRAVAK